MDMTGRNGIAFHLRARRYRSRAESAVSSTRSLLLALLVGVVLCGCAGLPKWQAQRTVTPEMVAEVLVEPGTWSPDLKPAEVPAIPVREHLRPCCAFGTHLQASFGPIPIPIFTIANVKGIDDLGPHKYDAGAFTLKGSSRSNAFTSEKNGLIYTCRGGFIDTAHVRDYADWTTFWATTIARVSETGATIELPKEGGSRRVIVRPVPAQLIKRYGLRRTAIGLAQWLAFQLSLWHEIATAYGYASIEIYPEYVSAFSPEDIYSNLLGIKIAGGMLMQTGSVATDSLYDQNMTTWLRTALQYLRPVSAEAGTSAMRLVDGLWWDSKARLPNPKLVLRRNLDAGDAIKPWQVSQAQHSPAMTAFVDKECGGSERPVILHRRRSARGIKFSDVLILEIDVSVPDPFPFPRQGSTQITQEDFPAVIESVRARVVGLLGPGADRPDHAGE